MKHLKRYNESSKSDIEMRNEIEELCNNCLTFLKDKGYMYNVIVYESYIAICINHKNMVGGLIGDSLDDIIPLYEILLKDYNLFHCSICYADSDRELPDCHEINKLRILSDEFTRNWSDKYLSELKIGIRRF
jgi:hypothetical protein